MSEKLATLEKKVGSGGGSMPEKIYMCNYVNGYPRWLCLETDSGWFRSIPDTSPTIASQVAEYLTQNTLTSSSFKFTVVKAGWYWKMTHYNNNQYQGWIYLNVGDTISNATGESFNNRGGCLTVVGFYSDLLCPPNPKLYGSAS